MTMVWYLAGLGALLGFYAGVVLSDINFERRLRKGIVKADSKVYKVVEIEFFESAFTND